jgi:hypothetical protein
MGIDSVSDFCINEFCWRGGARPGAAGRGKAGRGGARQVKARQPRESRAVNSDNYFMGLVYFLSDGAAIKIGATDCDVAHRRWALQVGCATQLELVGTIKTDFPFVMENSLHLKMAAKKIRRASGHGEWFNLTIAEAIEIIKENENGNIVHKTYSHAPGHPSHSVRPLWRGQQNQAGQHGQGLPQRSGGIRHPSVERVLNVISPKHAIGGEAFLR